MAVRSWVPRNRALRAVLLCVVGLPWHVLHGVRDGFGEWRVEWSGLMTGKCQNCNGNGYFAGFNQWEDPSRCPVCKGTGEAQR
jgi:hypothetical protein